jgi:hypothetical protein
VPGPITTSVLAGAALTAVTMSHGAVLVHAVPEPVGDA